MAKRLSEIKAEIQALKPLQKRELLGHLVAELEDSSNHTLDEVWLEEVQRRFHELKEGAVQGIPASQVFANLERRLG